MTITANNNEIGEVYFGSSAISEVYHGNDLVWSSGVTLTVNPTPNSATVTFNGSGQVSGNSIKVKKEQPSVIQFRVTAIIQQPGQSQ